MIKLNVWIEGRFRSVDLESSKVEFFVKYANDNNLKIVAISRINRIDEKVAVTNENFVEKYNELVKSILAR